jgi:hypothetical protein
MLGTSLQGNTDVWKMAFGQLHQWRLVIAYLVPDDGTSLTKTSFDLLDEGPSCWNPGVNVDKSEGRATTLYLSNHRMHVSWRLIN